MANWCAAVVDTQHTWLDSNKFVAKMINMQASRLNQGGRVAGR